MKQQKPLLPAHSRFLLYILSRAEEISIDNITKGRILTALNNGTYQISGMYAHDFNRLRSDYIKDFHEFEHPTTIGSVPVGGWFDCEQSEF